MWWCWRGNTVFQNTLPSFWYLLEYCYALWWRAKKWYVKFELKIFVCIHVERWLLNKKIWSQLYFANFQKSSAEAAGVEDSFFWWLLGSFLRLVNFFIYPVEYFSILSGFVFARYICPCFRASSIFVTWDLPGNIV